MEKQVHNKLKKDQSRFLNIITRANLLFQAHAIHLLLLRKAPAMLLKNATTIKSNFSKFQTSCAL